MTATIPLARGEVGKVGVPISHLGDMRTLFEGIPLADMNTSMTINACAAWLLSLYIAVADEQGADRAKLNGTTQNDIIKEYLSRGTYVFPPAPSMRLTKDVILFTTKYAAALEPDECLLLSPAGGGGDAGSGTRFRVANAIAILDTVKASGEADGAVFGEVVGRISFFVNAGMKFITEMCKMRAFVDLWDEICVNRYGITDAKQKLFRYGVQVNSLGLTEQQPENNVYRILIEMLASPSPRRPAPAPCSCRPGTRRSDCPAPSISNGRCACSRCSPMRRTCWTMAISSTARWRSTARSRTLKPRPARNGAHRSHGRGPWRLSRTAT